MVKRRLAKHRDLIACNANALQQRSHRKLRMPGGGRDRALPGLPRVQAMSRIIAAANELP